MAVANTYTLALGVLGAVLFAGLAFSLAFAIVPNLGWRANSAGFATFVSLSVAVYLGGLYATCDVAMRPFLPEMLFVLGPASLIVAPIGGLGCVISCVALAAAWHWIGHRFAPRLSIVQLAALIAIVALVSGFGSYGVWTALGVRPQSGNCVL